MASGMYSRSLANTSLSFTYIPGPAQMSGHDVDTATRLHKVGLSMDAVRDLLG